MQVIDVLGNALAKDDLVVVSQGDQQLVGLVLEISEPSLIAPGKNAMNMPGQVKVGLMPLTLLFDVRNPRLVNVVKVVKPPNFNKQES